MSENNVMSSVFFLLGTFQSACWWSIRVFVCLWRHLVVKVTTHSQKNSVHFILLQVEKQQSFSMMWNYWSSQKADRVSISTEKTKLGHFSRRKSTRASFEDAGVRKEPDFSWRGCFNSVFHALQQGCQT